MTDAYPTAPSNPITTVNHGVFNGLYTLVGVSQGDHKITGLNAITDLQSQTNHSMTGVKAIRHIGTDLYLTAELTGQSAWGQGGTVTNGGLAVSHQGKVGLDIGIAYDFMSLNTFMLEVGIGGQLIPTQATVQSGGGTGNLSTTSSGNRIQAASYFTALSVPYKNYTVHYKYETFFSKNIIIAEYFIYFKVV